MELPEIFESRGFPDGIPGKGCTSFCSAVVHDGHARSNAIQKKRTIAGERTVMGNDVNVNGAELVDGAHQQHFLIRSKVTQIKNAQFAKREESAERSWILTGLRGGLFRGLASGVRRARSRERMFNHGAVGSDHFGFNSLQRKSVSGFDSRALKLLLSSHLEIFLPGLLCRGVGRLTILAVIEKCADWNFRCELRDSSCVVEVVVREKDKINFLEASVSCRSDNAIRVTAIEAGPPCVNEKGLTGRGHKKRGLAALDANEINLKRL